MFEKQGSETAYVVFDVWGVKESKSKREKKGLNVCYQETRALVAFPCRVKYQIVSVGFSFHCAVVRESASRFIRTIPPRPTPPKHTALFLTSMAFSLNKMFSGDCIKSQENALKFQIYISEGVAKNNFFKVDFMSWAFVAFIELSRDHCWLCCWALTGLENTGMPVWGEAWLLRWQQLFLSRDQGSFFLRGWGTRQWRLALLMFPLSIWSSHCVLSLGQNLCGCPFNRPVHVGQGVTRRDRQHW